MLKSVLRFVFDNIGNPLSSKKIADTMTSDGRKIDTKTVEKISGGSDRKLYYLPRQSGIISKESNT